MTGKWADFAIDDARGGDPVSLAAYLRELFSVGSGTVAGPHARGGVMTDRSDAMFEPFTVDELQAAERAAARLTRTKKPEPTRPGADSTPPEPGLVARLRPEEAIGEPVGTWTLPYSEMAPSSPFYVVRWENPWTRDGRKVIRPVTWCQFPDASRAMGVEGRCPTHENALYRLAGAPEVS